MAQKAKIERYSDGTITVSNMRNNLGFPVYGVNETVSASRVLNWWDGTPMDDTKVDGSVYLKLNSLPPNTPPDFQQYVGSYFKVNLPNDGELFLEKDTMDDMRGLSLTEVLLLRMSFFKGVKLNGYYTKGDKPSLIYNLSETTNADDGGAVINLDNVSGLKLTTKFNDSIYIEDFGAKSNDNTFDNSPALRASTRHAWVEAFKPFAFLKSEKYYLLSRMNTGVDGRHKAIWNMNGATLSASNTALFPNGVGAEIPLVNIYKLGGSQGYPSLEINGLKGDGEMTFQFGNVAPANLRKLKFLAIYSEFQNVTLNDVYIENVQGRGIEITNAQTVTLNRTKTYKVGGKYGPRADWLDQDSFGDGVHVVYNGTSWIEGFNDHPLVNINNCSFIAPEFGINPISTNNISRCGLVIEAFGVQNVKPNSRIVCNINGLTVQGFDRGIHLEGGKTTININGYTSRYNHSPFYCLLADPIAKFTNSFIVDPALNFPNMTHGSMLGNFWGEFTQQSDISFENTYLTIGRSRYTMRNLGSAGGTTVGQSSFNFNNGTINWLERGTVFEGGNGTSVFTISNSKVINLTTTTSDTIIALGNCKQRYVNTSFFGPDTLDAGTMTTPNRLGVFRTTGSEKDIRFVGCTFQDVKVWVESNDGFNRIGGLAVQFDDCDIVRRARGTTPRMTGASAGDALFHFGKFRYVFFSNCKITLYCNTNEEASASTVDVFMTEDSLGSGNPFYRDTLRQYVKWGTNIQVDPIRLNSTI